MGRPRNHCHGRGCFIITAYGGYAVLILLLALSIVLDQAFPGDPVLRLLPQAGMYALIGFSICIAIAACSGRPIGIGDVIRIGCWTLIAGMEGLREMGFGYYRLGHHHRAVDIVTFSVMAFLAGVIVLSLPLCPPRPRVRGRLEGPRCNECGYLLVGLQLRRCPECGTPVHAGNESSSVP